MDEAAVWLTQPNTYTWHPVGTPMAVPTSKARGIRARLNLMGSVDLASGEVQYREIDGNTTSAEVVAVIDTLATQARPDCPTVVVLDQASIHTSAAVRQHRPRWIALGLFIAYLPSYSPELNPMEGRWRHLKYHDLSTRHFDDKAQLRQAVGAAHWGVAI